MIKKILHQIKELDQLGTPFSLNYNNSPQFNTVPGGLISICCGLMAIIIFAYLFLQLSNSSSVEMIVNEISTIKIPKFDLYASKFFISFIVQNRNRIFDGSKGNGLLNFVTPIGTIISRDIDYTKDPPQLVTSAKHFKYILCGDASEYVKSAFITHEAIKFWLETSTYCPDIDENTGYEVMSSFLEVPFSFIYLTLFPCTLPNPNDCAKDEDFLDT